jgi:ribosome maturation factor RimP
MLQEKEIRKLAELVLKDSGLFLVDVNVRKGNYIRVLIESIDGVNLEDCARINRLLEARLNRDQEDFELEVSSPGLNTPFKVFKQYLKNINKDVDVVMKDGMKISGKLVQVDNDGLTLDIDDQSKKDENKEKIDGLKCLLFSDIKSTKEKINI